MLKTQPIASKTLIVAHFDGHGVSCASILARSFEAKDKQYDVLCKYPETGPSLDIRKYVEEAAEIYILDIPFDIYDPVGFCNRNVSHDNVIYIDHHQTSMPSVLKAIQEIGIPKGKIFGFNTPLEMNLALTDLFDDDIISRKNALIGAVCDRDPAVIPHIKFRRQEKFFKLALGVDILVRKDTMEAFEKLRDGQYGYFLDLAEDPKEMPPFCADYHREGNTIILEEPADGTWGNKQIEKEFFWQRNAYVAVSPVIFKPKNRFNVRVTTNWLHPHLAAKVHNHMKYKGYETYGPDGNFSINFEDEEQMMENIDEIGKIVAEIVD